MKSFIKKHRRTILILIPTVIGLLYIALCSLNLHQSIWFDESYGAYLTRFSFTDIITLTAVDVHPPLYYCLLKIWSNIFGYTDFAMRFMSVFFGAIAIVFAFQWLKRSFGVKAAAIAGLFMSISPIFIRYGQEMRMYTLAAAIIFAATYVFTLAIDTRKRKHWVIYALLIALGMWTHYFVALIWLAQLIYLLIIYRHKISLKNIPATYRAAMSNPQGKNIIVAYFLAIIFYLPWLPLLVFQTALVQGGFWIAQPSFTTIADFFTNSLVYLDAGQVKGSLLLLLLATTIIFVVSLIRHRPRPRLALLMAFVPPAILLLLSTPPFKPVFVDRYIIYSSITISILFGLIIARSLPPKTKKSKRARWYKSPHLRPILIGLLFLATNLAGVFNVYALGNFNKDVDNKSDVKTLFNTIAEHSFLGEPIISRSEWIYYDASFYGSDLHPVYYLDEKVNYEWGSHEPLKRFDFGKIKNLEAFIESHDTFWYIIDSDGTTVPDPPAENLSVVQTLFTKNIVPDKIGYVATEYKRLD
jgi:uncharacterized membrane protein